MLYFSEILGPWIYYSYTIPFLGVVPVGKIALAALIFIASNTFFWLLRKIVLVQLRSWSQRTETSIDDAVIGAVQGIRVWVYSVVSLYAALHVFSWPEPAEKIFLGIFLFALVFQLIEIAVCFIDYAVKKYIEKGSDDTEIDANMATMIDMVRLVARIVLWVLGGLFVLSNLQIEVTSLIAGLGIGGIAVAFALQGILADLFASFSIYFDRPFRIGDFIAVGTDFGTVEKIGIKSTRIRTLQGEELVISNAELTGARVQNYEHMQERRIASQFSITYETEQALVERVPQIVKDIFTDLSDIRLDSVHLVGFGELGLTYELVYYVESADFVLYRDRAQAFNFALMRNFAEAGIEFAHFTQPQYRQETS